MNEIRIRLHKFLDTTNIPLFFIYSQTFADYWVIMIVFGGRMIVYWGSFRFFGGRNEDFGGRMKHFCTEIEDY